MTISHPPLRIAVIIASTGRAECVAQVIGDLRRQTLPASRIILSVASERDLPPPHTRAGAEVVLAPRGSAAQRNAGLDHLGGDDDVVIFYDDDFVPSRYALAGLSDLFSRDRAIVGATGVVLADGIKTPGIAYARAESIVADYDRKGRRLPIQIVDVPDLYGCNMAYRVSAIEGLRFDERLKLYGWQEDVDFAVQVARRGRTVRSNALVGVHLGIKRGRTSGVRLGYSQVQNPLYLWRKGTMPRAKAAQLMLRNVAMNHLRSVWPEPWVDRFGRVKGNWLGFADVLRGRLTPERIEEL